MDLHHIIYVSKGVDTTQQQIDDILTECKKFNATKDITGMLLYIEGKFFQVIEGKKKDIDDLYAKIRIDPRHRKITTVSAHPIKFRTFKDWTMRFNAISEKEFYKISGISSWESLLSLKPGPEENTAFIFSQKFANKQFPSPNWWVV